MHINHAAFSSPAHQLFDCLRPLLSSIRPSVHSLPVLHLPISPPRTRTTTHQSIDQSIDKSIDEPTNEPINQVAPDASAVHNFTTSLLPGQYVSRITGAPFKVSIVGDIGQTPDSVAT